MSRLKQLAFRLRALFRKEKLDADMAEEMRLHLELRTQRNLDGGMTPEDARFAAQRSFGGTEQIRERARDERGWVWLEQTRQDFRYAFRHLAKAPGFAAVAILTLALGIGVNAVMFPLIRDTVLRPTLRDRKAQLVDIYTRQMDTAPNFRGLSHEEFIEVQATKEIFADVAAMSFGTVSLGPRDEVRARQVIFVSENYFSLLQVRPHVGRFFAPEEVARGAEQPVVVASYAFWQQLGARPDFVGSQIEINQRPFTVIGIAPPGFGGLHIVIGPAVWLPLNTRAAVIPGERDLYDVRSRQLSLCGSLQPGLTLATAGTRLAGLGPIFQGLSSAAERRQLLVTPPSRISFGSTAPLDESFLTTWGVLTLALGTVVLIVACLNLANMLLARGAARRKEIALRMSLGASRRRIVRQLVTEGLVLAFAGSVVGLLLSLWTGNLMWKVWLDAFDTTTFAPSRHPSFDVTLLSCVLVLGVLATLVFSLWPAIRATKLDLVTDLKQHSCEMALAGRGNRFFSLHHCLVMGQISLSLMSLFSAGLFLRGSLAATQRQQGFETDGELVFNLDYSLSGLAPDELLRRQAALLARATTIPGVARAALASGIPYTFDLPRNRVRPAGADAPPAADTKTPNPFPFAGYTYVSHGYFATLGISLLRGRDFTPQENATRDGNPVVIIDDALARALFGEQDPLGRYIRLGESAAATDREIVGIIRSPHNDVHDRAPPLRCYLPFSQATRPRPPYLHVQAAPSAPLPELLNRLQRELRAFEPSVPVLIARPLGDFVFKNINLMGIKMAAAIFSVFGAISLVLTVVGVYGVKAYNVALRTREIGIRVALGAQARDVIGLILRQGALQTAFAVVAGIGLALVAGKVLSGMLYRVSAVDPLLLAAAAALIASASLLACFVPARRATRVDPIIALRSE